MLGSGCGFGGDYADHGTEVGNVRREEEAKEVGYWVETQASADMM